MACLCAPTTHEGSFRCRLHRGIPLVTNSAQLAANYLKGGSHEISDQLCSFTSACSSPSTASSASHQAVRDSHKSSLPSPWARPASSASSSSSSSSLPFRYSRPPPSKRSAAISSSRSSCPGSFTSCEASATRCTPTALNASHAAALAIMKQHLHNKHIKSHGNRNINIWQRSSAAYKIGPSRLSRMARAASTDEVPALKNADCCTPNPPPQSMVSSSFNSDGPQARGLTSVEATPIKFKMHSVVPKFKQSESSCKLVGYKAGPLIVSTVY